MPRVRIERKTDWSLRKANADDIESLQAFYRLYTWKNKDAEIIYDWKYEKNPFGKTLMWLGFDSANKVVSNCVFMPWVFLVNGREIGATQVVDGVTQLEYRGQGISFQQMEKGINDYRQKGSPICFAFPNEAGVAVHKRHNGHHLGHIIRHTKPLKTEYIVKKFIKSDVLSKIAAKILTIFLKLASRENYCFNLKGLSFQKVKQCGTEFDDFWKRFAKSIDKTIITQKNSAYLNWKYVNSPNKKRELYALSKNNKIHGFIVLESADKVGYIVDIAADNKMALNHLIAKTVEHFRRVGVDSIVFVALENNIYFGNLRKFGFIERPDVKHFFIYLDDSMDNKSYLTDSKNWFITIGDCDIEKI